MDSKLRLGSSIFLVALVGNTVPSEAKIGSLKRKKPPGPCCMVAMKPLITLEGSFLQRGSFAVLPFRSIFVSVYVSVVLWVSDALGEFFVPLERPLTFDESTTVPLSPLRDRVSVTVPSLRMSMARLCERKLPLSLTE